MWFQCQWIYTLFTFIRLRINLFVQSLYRRKHGIDFNCLFETSHERCQRSCRRVFNHFMMTSSNGIIFGVTGPLCGEFNGHRWIPLTKASDAELHVFFDLRINKRLSKQSRRRWLCRHRMRLFCDIMNKIWKNVILIILVALFRREGFATQKGNNLGFYGNTSQSAEGPVLI